MSSYHVGPVDVSYHVGPVYLGKPLSLLVLTRKVTAHRDYYEYASYASQSQRSLDPYRCST